MSSSGVRQRSTRVKHNKPSQARNPVQVLGGALTCGECGGTGDSGGMIKHKPGCKRTPHS